MLTIHYFLTAPPQVPAGNTDLRNYAALWQSVEVWKKFLDLLFSIIPQMLWALGILLLTRLAINVMTRTMRRVLNRTEPTLRKFLIQAAEILTMVVGVVAALNAVGIQATSLVAVVGAAGLAIGLAWQNTLSHFAAGVMLISLRPFEVGDYIEGAGVAGVVDAIGIFSTTLLTADHIKITVPNAQLFNGTLKNTTAMKTRRVDIDVNIGERPIAATISHLLVLVESHPLVFSKPHPTAVVTSIASGTVLSVRPWCASQDYEQVKSQVQLIIKEALQDEPEPEKSSNI
ncbi:mechanosensitive ion channel family protein [Ancylothrix sp. C2]|uniref:mechanosensitive ion channel family protein n=1 Tax=Ancylothrix sp. D3o TaxID=2953691 RepID=UPI0021BB0EAD|nr:mechanosensitive ion channel family protein [Ancylothrix sp. D3o]MCT7949894.1 mechanosensitive ion channel family protein [Ancylothrix sp. D3o]